MIHAEQIQVTFLDSADERRKEHVVLFRTIHHNPLRPCEAVLDSGRPVVAHSTIQSEEYHVSVLQNLTVFLPPEKVEYSRPLAAARRPVAP